MRSFFKSLIWYRARYDSAAPTHKNAHEVAVFCIILTSKGANPSYSWNMPHNLYEDMYKWQWDLSLHPIKYAFFTEV